MPRPTHYGPAHLSPYVGYSGYCYTMLPLRLMLSLLSVQAMLWQETAQGQERIKGQPLAQRANPLFSLFSLNERSSINV